MSATGQQYEDDVHDAFERGKAAGYAAAVADVVAWLEAEREAAMTTSVPDDETQPFAQRVVVGAYTIVVEKLRASVHVGAAKKGG